MPHVRDTAYLHHSIICSRNIVPALLNSATSHIDLSAGPHQPVPLVRLSVSIPEVKISIFVSLHLPLQPK